MTKPTDLTELRFNRFSVKPGVRPLRHPLVCRGFDTETGLDGNILVIACDDGQYEVGEPVGDVLAFLTRPEYKNSFNFFYNLGFDHNAIFRSVLTPDKLDDLNYAGRAFCGRYFLEFIPGKLLKIVKKGSVWRYYDISKFYKSGVSGRLTDVYRSVFGRDYQKSLDASKGFNVVDENVINYCIEDARACRELADNLVIPTNRLVPMKEWHSGATLAKAMRKQNLVRPYSFKPSRLQQFAMNAYGGARIEVFKRGAWGFNNNEHLWMYDIRSAYPSVQCGLYDIGNSIVSEEPVYFPDALHSFFLIDLKIEDMVAGPLKHKFGNVVYYPVGECGEAWVDKNELELLMDLDIRFHIQKAAHDLSKPGERPYEYMKKMYEERLRCKKSRDESERQLEFPLKLALNSSYGMLIERIPKKEIKTKFTLEEQENEDNYALVREDGGISLVSNVYSAGQFFNPVHACEVTSAIRCKIYRDALPHMEHLVKFATDSITFDKPVKLDFGDKLGQYEDSPRYDGVVVGSGVYSMYSEDRKKKVCKFRSFDKTDLMELSQSHADDSLIEIVRKAPIKLKEAVRERYRWFNTFQEKRKKMDINFDHRRAWMPKKMRDLRHLMEGVYDSRPLDYQDLVKVKMVEEESIIAGVAPDLIDSRAYHDSTLSAAENRQVLEQTIRDNVRF